MLPACQSVEMSKSQLALLLNIIRKSGVLKANDPERRDSIQPLVSLGSITRCTFSPISSVPGLCKPASFRNLAVRLEGANHQWRKIPPGELSIDPEADERFLLGDRLSWSLVTKVALGG